MNQGAWWLAGGFMGDCYDDMLFNRRDFYTWRAPPWDVNEDALCNVVDMTLVSFAFGTFLGEPEFNPDADINEDDVIDTRDLCEVAYRLGQVYLADM
jgi:hypothetical protein